VVNRTLRRKLLRDLRAFRGQLVAITVIMACGVASFVTVLTAYAGLERSRHAYYSTYRMPDLFAPCKKAPATVAREVERIPGVRRARARITFDVTLDLPDLPEPASGRVVSLPDLRRPVIGDVHLARGRWFEGDGTRQVIVAKAFADVHGLDVGDRVHAIMNHRKVALTIVGVGLSPEHVYMVRGGGATPSTSRSCG
jgi:putative ABC transport system permease protein